MVSSTRRAFLFTGLFSTTLLTLLHAQTWQDITPNVPGPLSMGNHRPMDTDGQRLYVLGTTGVYVSADNGATFQPLNTVQDASYSLTNSGHRFIKYVNGFVWLGSDPGSRAVNEGFATLHRLTPGQSVWVKSSSGFPILTTGNQADDITYDPATGTYYVAAAIGGAMVSTNGTDWQQRTSGLGGIGLPCTVVAANGTAFFLRPLSTMHRSTNQGQSWSPLTSYPGGASFLYYHRGRVLLAPGDFVYYSDDGGETWKSHTGLKGGRATDISGDGNLLFAAAGLGYFGADSLKFSATDGLTWDLLPTNGLAVTVMDSRIVRQGDYLFMHVPSPQKLYRLNIAGMDFTPTTQSAQHPPTNVNLIAGQPLRLSVAAGGVNLSYQWQRNGVDIPGATSAVYSVAPAATNDSGSYRVIVTGTRGVVTSTVANVTVVLREEGRRDITYPSLNLGGQLQLLPNGELLVFVNNAFYRLSPEGATLASRTVSGVNTFTSFTLRDSSNRVLLISGSPSRLWRILPDTLANDPTFNQMTANGIIRTVTEWPGRGYFVGGDFTAVTNAGISTNTAWYLVLINYAGVVETAFNYLTNGPNSSIYNVAVASGTNLFMHGTFSAWSGTQLYQNSGLVKLTPTLARDPSFAPTAPLTDGTTKFYSLPPDKILALVGNNTAYPTILTAQGVVDTNFNPANLRFNSFVNGMALGESNKLYFGGTFSRYGTNNNAGYVRLLPNGQEDLSFVNNTGSGNVTSLAYDPRGYLYLTTSTQPRGPHRLFAGVSQPASTGGFAEWVTQFGLTQGHQTAGADADGDGIPNIFEYYFGSNPADAASGNRPAAAHVQVGAEKYPAISFVRQRGVSGVTLSAQVSATPTFNQLLGTPMETVFDLGGGRERVFLRSPVSATAQPVQFLRIRLEMP
jgi:hypothetical protein